MMDYLWNMNDNWNITYRQFHQHFMRPFFVRKFVQSQTLSREKTFVQKIRQ